MAGHVTKAGTPVRLRGEAVGVLVIKLGGTAMAFAAQLVLARMVGADGVGAYALAMALLNSLLVFSRMGFDMSPLRVVTLLDGDGDAGRLRGFLRVGRGLPLLAGVGLAGVAAAGVTLGVPRGYVRTSLLVACLGLPLWTILLVDQGLLRALGHRVTAFLAGEVLRPGLLLAGLLLLAGTLHAPEDAPRAVAIHVAAMGVGAAMGAVLLHRTVASRIRGVDPEHDVPAWMRISIGLGIVTGVSALLNQVDTLIVGSLLETSQVGLFSIARRIATLLAFGLLAVNSVVAPSFSRLHRDGDREALASLSRRASWLAVGATLPLAAFLAVAGRWILAWFGPEFVAAYPLLLIFCAGQVMNAASGPVALLLSLTGYARDTARVLGVALAVLVAGCFAVVPRYGVMGAAATSATVLAGWNVALIWLSVRRLGIRGSIL